MVHELVEANDMVWLPRVGHIFRHFLRSPCVRVVQLHKFKSGWVTWVKKEILTTTLVLCVGNRYFSVVLNVDEAFAAKQRRTEYPNTLLGFGGFI